jgi:hypothetical protein
MSAPEHPADGDGPQGRPTRTAPTDFLSRPDGAGGHEPSGDRSAEFIQELQRHAEQHRSRVPAPDGRDGSAGPMRP